jgi:hypothetical protein
MPGVGRYNRVDPNLINKPMSRYVSSNYQSCMSKYQVNPLSGYPYNYSNSNPVSYFDLQGLSCYTVGFGGALGLIGAAATGYQITCCDNPCGGLKCCRQFVYCYCIGAGGTGGIYVNISSGNTGIEEGYSCNTILAIGSGSASWGKGIGGGGYGPGEIGYFKCCCKTDNLSCWNTGS